MLDTEEYNTWLSSRELLWIKGDPGKGKTMLMCGVIDELEDNTAYFFCQATIDTKNTATQVLRGLIFAILEENPSLSEGVHDRIERASSLPDESAFYILKEAIEHLLATHQTTVMIDALDECSTGLDKLLRFIVRASASYGSRWLITSRNNPEIIEALEETSQLSLELNEFSVIEAVTSFINYKVQILTRVKKYDENLRTFILNYLIDNATGTFLWVSLVCLNLSTVRLHQTKAALLEYPSGLEALYRRMLRSIESSPVAHRLRQILAVMCIIFRPISLEELSTLIESIDEGYSVSWIEDMVNDCRSFLTIRNSVVQFVHQSAKDFLMLKETKSTFPDGKLAIHQHVFSSSLQCLQSLSRNMYGLKEPGAMIDNIEVPMPDPLIKMKYASIYWIDHLLYILDSPSVPLFSLADADLISNFFKTKCLYWLEALSLLRNIYPTLLAITKLVSRIRALVSHNVTLTERPSILEALDLISDALQCLRYFQYALIRFPLQVYVSVLVFSPTQSLIKHYFSHEIPRWVVAKKGLRKSWPPNLSLDAKGQVGMDLRWSPDGRRLATHSLLEPLRVWDAVSGQLLSTVNDKDICKFVFARNSETLKLINKSCSSILSYSAINGQLLETTLLESTRRLSPAALYTGVFSQDATLVAYSTTSDGNIYISCTSLGTTVKTLVCGDSAVQFLNFSPDNLHIVFTDRRSVDVWNIQSGSKIWHLAGASHATVIFNIAFSPCSKLLAIQGSCFSLWRWQDHQNLYTLNQTLQGISYGCGIAFHPNYPCVFVSHGRVLREWSIDRPTMPVVCGSFGGHITAAAISKDGRNLAASDADTVKIWHTDSRSFEIDEDITSESIFEDLCLAHNAVYGIANNTTTEIHKWFDMTDYSQNLVMHLEIRARQWSISQDCSKVAFYGDESRTIEIWNWNHGSRISRLQESKAVYSHVCWRSNQDQLTVCNTELSLVVLYEIYTGQIIDQWDYPNTKGSFPSINAQWSNQGTLFAMGHFSGLQMWDTGCREWVVFCTKGDYGWSRNMLQFSPSGSLLLAASGGQGLRVFRTDTRIMVLNFPDDCHSFYQSIDEQWLKTDRAYFTSPGGFLVPDETVVSHPAVHLNMEMNPFKDRSWIRSGTDNIIWLPQDFRPPEQSWDIVDSTVAMISTDGSLVILDITWDHSKDFDSQDQDTEIEALSKRRRSSLVPIAERLKNS